MQQLGNLSGPANRAVAGPYYGIRRISRVHCLLAVPNTNGCRECSASAITISNETKKEREEEDKEAQMNNKRIFMVERSVSIQKGSLKCYFC